MNKHAKQRREDTEQNHPSPEVSGRSQPYTTSEGSTGMQPPLEKYQVWEQSAPGIFRLTLCDSLMDCISVPKSGRWFVTKGVSLAVMDQDDLAAPTEQLRAVSQQPVDESYGQRTINTEPEDEEKEALRRYLAGI